ncbi:MAG TPA: SigE family RNA polymerase sigma factor [Kineosporiaceae bacterium]
MTVTVALGPAAPCAGRAAARSGGLAEVAVHVVPGDAGPDTEPGDRPDVRSDVAPVVDAAIAELYQQHWNRLVRLAALLTRDASVAEEIVQDAFVSLHRRWGDLAEHASAAAYLRTSVVNGSRSTLRHRGVEEKHRQPGPPEPAGPEEHAVRADSDARVMAALRTLSRRQQEVLVLRYYGDYSEQDIAATLGLSKGAVKSHAHRGLAALREALVRIDHPATGEVSR